MKEHRQTIVVVDDVLENLQVISEVLQKQNYNLIFARNGKQAIEVIKDKLPDLILMDIAMPEMDGIKACQHLKADPKTKGIPLIFLTARTEKDNIVEGFKSGGVDYITKPFYSEELLARVQTHLELKNAVDKISAQNMELKELNATKDKFFRIIGHDLKNPIAQVIQFAELIDVTFDSLSEAKLKEFLKYMKESSFQSLKLLENLLSWARSQTNAIAFVPVVFDLHKLVNDVFNLLIKSAEAKNIKFVNSIPIESRLFADENMINTVIRNLVSNAIKFTNENGIIEVGIIQNESSATLYVKDNGIGMSDSICDKLFKIDSGYTTVGTNNEKGTGIGLILCKEFIDKHKGQIWVESEIDKGSTFNFKIPMKQE